MLFLVLCGFAAYNFWKIVTRPAEMRKLGVSIIKQVFWMTAVVVSMFGLLVAATPRTAGLFPLYPLPIAFLYFVAPIVVGPAIRNQLIKQGTSLTEELEKTASNTTWIGIFGIAFVMVNWCIKAANTKTVSAVH